MGPPGRTPLGVCFELSNGEACADRVPQAPAILRRTSKPDANDDKRMNPRLPTAEWINQHSHLHRFPTASGWMDNSSELCQFIRSCRLIRFENLGKELYSKLAAPQPRREPKPRRVSSRTTSAN